jgi:polygalacturonase
VTPAPAPEPPWADVTAFGAVGDGRADDTAAFARAAATGRPIRVPRPRAHYRLTGKIRLQASIVGVGMPEIRMYGAQGQETHAALEVRDYDGPGLVIRGLHLDGQWDGIGTKGEWSHLVVVKGSRNVTIEGNLLERPYGDCILVGGEGVPRPSVNVVIRGNRLLGPRRCAVALIAVRNAVIRANVIRKTSDYVTAIDLEPNPNGVDSVWGVEITGNHFDVPNAVSVMLYQPTHDVAPGGPGGDVVIRGNTARRGRLRFFTTVGAWARVQESDNRDLP